jgi:hypothetical protein
MSNDIESAGRLLPDMEGEFFDMLDLEERAGEVMGGGFVLGLVWMVGCEFDPALGGWTNG